MKDEKSTKKEKDLLINIYKEFCKKHSKIKNIPKILSITPVNQKNKYLTLKIKNADKIFVINDIILNKRKEKTKNISLIISIPTKNSIKILITKKIDNFKINDTIWVIGNVIKK